MPIDLGGAVGEFDLDLAGADDRMLILADLIARRQIGIEIVLPVEAADRVDARVQPEAGAHRLGDAFAVDDRQHAGEAGIDEADLAVRLRAESRRGAAEQLGVADHLGMDFEADHHFPGAGRAFERVGHRGCLSSSVRYLTAPGGGRNLKHRDAGALLYHPVFEADSPAVPHRPKPSWPGLSGP